MDANPTKNKFSPDLNLINRYLPQFMKMTKFKDYEDLLLDHKMIITTTELWIDEKKLFKDELAGNVLFDERQEVKRAIAFVFSKILDDESIMPTEADYQFDRINYANTEGR